MLFEEFSIGEWPVATLGNSKNFVAKEMNLGYTFMPSALGLQLISLNKRTGNDEFPSSPMHQQHPVSVPCYIQGGLD